MMPRAGASYLVARYFRYLLCRRPRVSWWLQRRPKPARQQLRTIELRHSSASVTPQFAADLQNPKGWRARLHDAGTAAEIARLFMQFLDGTAVEGGIYSADMVEVRSAARAAMVAQPTATSVRQHIVRQHIQRAERRSRNRTSTPTARTLTQ